MASLIEEYKGQVNGHIDALHEANGTIIGLLRQIVDGVQNQLAENEWFMRSGQAAVGAAETDAEIRLGPVPAGAYWIVKTLNTTGGIGGPCAVYFDAIEPSQLAYFIANAQIFTPAGPTELFVRERSSLIFHFYSQPNNQICTSLIQGKQYLVRPSKLAHAAQFEDTDAAPRHILEPQRPM
jgi:hypothetical protein